MIRRFDLGFPGFVYIMLGHEKHYDLWLVSRTIQLSEINELMCPETLVVIGAERRRQRLRYIRDFKD